MTGTTGSLTPSTRRNPSRSRNSLNLQSLHFKALNSLINSPYFPFFSSFFFCMTQNPNRRFHFSLDLQIEGLVNSKACTIYTNFSAASTSDFTGNSSRKCFTNLTSLSPPLVFIVHEFRKKLCPS